MSARELALELSQLKPKERANLLAELPDERRIEIEGLLADVDALLLSPAPRRTREPPRAFEAHIDAAMKSPSEALAALNPGQIRLLLAAEHPAVQQRLMSMVCSRELDSLAPAVRAAVEEYLTQRLSATHLHASAPRPQTSRWWNRFVGRTR